MRLEAEGSDLRYFKWWDEILAVLRKDAAVHAAGGQPEGLLQSPGLHRLAVETAMGSCIIEASVAKKQIIKRRVSGGLQWGTLCTAWLGSTASTPATERASGAVGWEPGTPA
jgi:hypothetical protein